jgi:three-Cys-motif partner protein
MSTENFFEVQTPESRAKTGIVVDHFAAWQNIIGSRSDGELAYLDLYAGPGRFEDGTDSTPPIIVRKMIESKFASRFRVVFNEKEPAYAADLQKVIGSISGLHKLAAPPLFLNEELTRDNYQRFLREIGDRPAIMFVDPWGYKGVTLDLFKGFVDGSWGRDAFFFFNYKRINAGINVDQVKRREHMRAMFGETRADQLDVKLRPLRPDQREAAIHEAMGDALHEIGVQFVERFDFSLRGDSLFFVTQNLKGLETAKNKMAKWSVRDEDGVAQFATPTEAQKRGQSSLFDIVPSFRPLAQLRKDLLSTFAGQSLTFSSLFQRHHPGTHFVEPNYREALKQMESDGEIQVTVISGGKRHPGTFGPTVMIHFQRVKE